MNKLLRGALVALVLVSNIGCDQASKHIVRQKVNFNEEISLMSHYVTLTRVENTGAFLSLGNNLHGFLKLLLLTMLPVTVLGAAFVILVTKKNLSVLSRAGICFLLGGGMGNIYDRILYGSVTDFLHIDFVIFQTGIFNMADVSIMTGMVMLLIGSYAREAVAGSQDL